MDRPRWILDERAYAGAEHLDPSYVATYNHKAQVDPSEDLEILRTLGLNDQSIVVDLGAGSGAFALAVAPLCHRVIAVDISSAMVAAMRAAASAQGLDNIECVQAGFHIQQAEYDSSRIYAAYTCVR